MDFLLEIGTEEIPARMIDAAQAELARRIGELLARERLAHMPEVTGYSTPRRLAVLARGIERVQPELREEALGPAAGVAQKNPKAAEAFARKCGVSVAELQTVATSKGDYLAATVVRQGRYAAELLAEAVPVEIAGIYWPKSMYWRHRGERFIRPVRWLVALLDGEIVPLQFGGINAAAESRGHRQLASGPVFIERAAQYVEALANARVLMRPDREHKIRKALDAAARAIPGARWREDQELLDTVVNLTEFPSVICGGIDREFLSLPQEVLVTVMRDHQKYFALDDAHGRLAPYFLSVVNTDGDPAGLIRHGNERVLRARFRDARFFWDIDQKIPLRQRVEMLKHVTFQKDLGSYYEKAQRMAKLADNLLQQLKAALPRAAASAKSAAGVSSMGSAPSVLPVDSAALQEAALLAKTDLTTELVKEFTELQGVVGGLYAKAQALPENIADAIYDHYKPVSMDAAAPRTLEGALLAIADKADSIAGMFALGLHPTGSKDPFALRRQANGIVKIIAEHKLPLSLSTLLEAALHSYGGSEAAGKFKAEKDVLAATDKFLRERVEFYLQDVLGYAYDVVNAALAAGVNDVVDAIARAGAVTEVRPSADFEPIAIAFKRMKNILRQAEESGKWKTPAGQEVGRQVVIADAEPAEKELAMQAGATAVAVAEMRKSKHYAPALIEISKLRPAVDRFFDKVMVMADDKQVRTRRLALLHTLVSEFSSIADFSEIVVAGAEKK